MFQSKNYKLYLLQLKNKSQKTKGEEAEMDVLSFQNRKKVRLNLLVVNAFYRFFHVEYLLLVLNKQIFTFKWNFLHNDRLLCLHFFSNIYWPRTLKFGLLMTHLSPFFKKITWRVALWTKSISSYILAQFINSGLLIISELSEVHYIINHSLLIICNWITSSHFSFNYDTSHFVWVSHLWFF